MEGYVWFSTEQCNVYGADVFGPDTDEAWCLTLEIKNGNYALDPKGDEAQYYGGGVWHRHDGDVTVVKAIDCFYVPSVRGVILGEFDNNGEYTEEELEGEYDDEYFDDEEFDDIDEGDVS